MGKHDIPDVKTLFSQSGLSAAALEHLSKRFRLFQFDKDMVVIEKGKRGHFLAIVAQGQVEVEDETGKLRTLGSGEKFGEEMLHLGSPSLVTATTRTRAQLWVLTRKDYLAAEQLQDIPISSGSVKKRRQGMIPALILIAAVIAGLLFLYPEFPNAVHYYVTRTLIDADRPDLAERYLLGAAGIQPGSAQVFDELGYALYIQGKLPQSLDAFTKAVSLDPESASAQNNLGVLLISLNQPEKAIDHLTTARDLDPGNGEIYFNLGNAYLTTGDRQTALTAYRRAVDMDPGQIDAMSQIAGLLMEDGQYDPALEQWQAVLRLQPENIKALRGIGLIAVTNGDYSGAIEKLQKVTAVDPADASSHFYLGLAFEGLQMFDEAIKQYEVVRMLTEDPILLEQVKIHLEQISQ